VAHERGRRFGCDDVVVSDATNFERRDDETDPAWGAFRQYRDQPQPRSLARLALELGKSRQLFEGWSARHEWTRRVAAYDRYLDARRRQEREDEILAMERRHEAQLKAGSSALTQPIRAYLQRVAELRGEGEEPFAELSLAELHRLAMGAIRHLSSVVAAERLVAGLSTEAHSSDALASVEEARRRADAMSRSEIETFLLGVDDGRREMLRESCVAAHTDARYWATASARPVQRIAGVYRQSERRARRDRQRECERRIVRAEQLRAPTAKSHAAIRNQGSRRPADPLFWIGGGCGSRPTGRRQ
jgi:hypothetical protein